MSNRPSEKRPMKAKFEDVLDFAFEVVDDPIIRPILDEQISSPPPVKDEDSEAIEMKLLKRVGDIIKSRGICWKLKSGYNRGLSITRAIIRGDIADKADPRARELLRNASSIDFGDE